MKENWKILPGAIVIAGILVASGLLYEDRNEQQTQPNNQNAKNTPQDIQDTKRAQPLSPQNFSEEAEKIFSSAGIMLSVDWDDLEAKLVSVGVIDAEKFKQNKSLLNLLWALGLAQSSPILDSGEMVDPRYGGAENFASTGGWTIARGSAMEHYSRHKFFDLTAEEQALVDKMSRGIYRPCCNNSTHFPDCNHGMAMLGLLELMASQGASEDEMWKAALSANSYWFPEAYSTIAEYMKEKGAEWINVNPREILGAEFSSASGFAKISAQVKQKSKSGGGSCSV